MLKNFWLYSAAAAALLLGTLSAQAQTTAAAEGTSSARTGKHAAAAKADERPIPRQPDGKPDFTGIWQGGGPIGDIAQGLMKGQEIVMLPAAQKLFDSRKSADDPEANCLPTGVPRISPYPWRIVQTPPYGKPTHMFFLFEGNIHSYRQIFLDGRKHPDDLEATWYGNSIGHWEGDTLVVDTIGFNDRFWFDFKGHPHTKQLHVIERYTRTSYDTLENITTIIDPGAYAKPFTVRFVAHLKPGEELMEYICNENNQDVTHIEGKPGL